MIYTLYSYKGGVGRSMALANLGECFFQRGLKVVMIDWDLEAPGLEAYFYSDPRELSRVTARRGLIDMLREYKERYPQLARRRAAADQSAKELESLGGEDDVTANVASTEETKRETAEVAAITKQFLEKHSRRSGQRLRLAQSVQPVVSPGLTFDEILDQGLPPVDKYLEQVERSGGAGLWLLTAGARTREKFGDYADAVQDFDWLEFLAKYQGKDYLEWLRKSLGWADVVLIDSRTGVTEMGGVCTRQMADAVISFCAPNAQNIDGVARVVSSLGTEAAKRARLDRDLQVLVIPTRIDDSESALVGKFAEDFDERLELGKLPAQVIPDRLKGLSRPLWALQVPYIPKFNYREQLVIGLRAVGDGRVESPSGTQTVRRPDPPTQKLIRAYENIAVHLALLAEPGTRMRLAYASEIATQFPQIEQHTAPRMAPQVPGNWIERRDAMAPLQEALLNYAKAPNGGRVAVCGLAGMGKTSLVARVCQVPEVLEAFPDGTVWLAMEGPGGKERIQEFLRTSFGISRHGGEEALGRALQEKRFLWVVDDVWTPEQLRDIFTLGGRCTRVIITRDSAITSQFADTVINVGSLTQDQSRQLLKIPAGQPDLFQRDDTLAWLGDWPLGASLLAAALERSKVAADALIEQLKKAGLKLLDRPDTPGRNGSVSLSLGDSLGRLLPAERRLLIDVATGRTSQREGTPEAQRLRDLGLVIQGEGGLRAHEVIRQLLLGQGDLTGDAEARRIKERTEKLDDGYKILRGRAATLKETRQAAEFARSVRAFSLARKLFKRTRKSPDAAGLPEREKLKLIQQHALCTYKDDDLIAEERFQDALDILGEGDLHGANPSQETLGQAGAIHKGKWRLSGQRRDMERSLGYYQRGAEASLEGDFGYTRINAAFALDLLARQEQAESPAIAEARRGRASRLREEIAAELPGLAAKPGNEGLKREWWYGATMAEALFGLKRFAEARHWLREAIALDPPAWQLETTTRQMAMLALAQDVKASENTEAWQTLAMLVGDSAGALRGITAGKVGLALSGGGFRASLFHIGVLARLAELDVLRHVEVLSCVSGGSIIGAHYYLEVRHLLQQKRDSEITRDDYIEIVRRLEREFLAGVQKNLRMRLFAGWWANCKSLLVRGYTRTQYLAEMFERHIYSRVHDGEKGERWLDSLQTRPKDAGEDFNPKLDNWRRAAKVPILLLNATTLNTGHVWQFAVSWMGEPPQSATSSVDSNDLLRRMYYHEAPARYRNIRLGHAVAASACVPGLFDPIELDGLFPERTLRLVDGGVHDNQGIAGLLEQECNVVLVSDASGQMNSEARPSGDTLPVLMRSNSISMARVREAEFQGLRFLRRSSALSGLMFVHLKKDLDVHRVDWLGCPEPYPEDTRTTLTGYGVPKGIQSKLAGLRTDLDTFSDAEAYALMLSGYRMASHELKSCLEGFPVADASRESWRFMAIEPTVDRTADFEHDRLRQILSVGGGRWAKPFLLKPFASCAMLVAVVLALVAFAAGVYTLLPFTPSPLVEAGRFVPYLALGALVAIALFALLRRKTYSVLLTGIVMVTVGWFFGRIYLWCFEHIFRSAGAVRLRESDAKSPL